ncbi:glycoside hydrolase family 3 protein [Streptomyces albipurpureus]|uniref:beta-glucosidase n=1 Tax=Streptomyces albipurpureus TaxID=2897419 RepID=A0ABT0UFP5_9ACTN|nr:glycoside hydrolase family 3 N-terminal domain-containing protein [Streptomyces sp. CWNU-1]MCM2387442.1 glycoside hydrolase family 3 C-terminal domain-containing protein [Streptomyces sp. CWNU-1]
MPATIPYLDPALPIERRVDDLLARMTLEEKAGQLFHTANVMNDDGTLLDRFDHANGIRPTAELVNDRHITHFNLLNGDDPEAIATWHNHLQRLAVDTRLGIPVTLSSDPRHGVFSSPATGQTIERLSRWPEHTGIAAIGDERTAREYGDVVRREYLALGIRVALGPMADLFTEPRWTRGYGTFGEDADTVARMTAAFIRGLRGTATLGPGSVAAMVKHFPGAGPQQDGEDAHDHNHPEQVYPGHRQALHLRPFEAAFDAGVTQVMTYYGMPMGTGDWEEVGFAFNRPVVTDLLRRHYGFDGIVCTDWNVIDSTALAGELFGPNAYGLEHLTPAQRIARALEAGVDQFGGDISTELVVELVRAGDITTDRIDISVRRLLREKFRLGLFENRYVDPQAAARTVGSPPLQEAARTAQRRSLVLLKNDASMLPLSGRPKVYAEGFDPAVLTHYADAVATPEEADVALLRLVSPWEERDGVLGAFFHGGSLDFPTERVDEVRAVAKTVPTVACVYLERPAILTPIDSEVTALIGDFGSHPDALLDLVFGRTKPEGRLPFDLPSSSEAVEAAREDVPFDTHKPLYRFSHGLTY